MPIFDHWYKARLLDNQWRSDGGAGGAWKFVKIHIVFLARKHMFACKKNKASRPACTYRQLLRWVLGCVRFEHLLTSRETYALNRLSSFKNLRRKGGKFDRRPGRPKVLLGGGALRRLSNRMKLLYDRPRGKR